jgi:hypothetical protein
MSAIAPNIIINAGKDMVNLPQTRNDNFQPEMKLSVRCIARSLLCALEQNQSIQNNANGRSSKAFAVGALFLNSL